MIVKNFLNSLHALINHFRAFTFVITVIFNGCLYLTLKAFFLNHLENLYAKETFIFQSLFSFSAPVDIDIRFNGEENRKLVEVKVDRDRRERFPLYFDGETVAGRVINYF
jgi:hypothetical protein